MNDLIGFFDSGVGGVSVLHTARRILPNEHFLYYGDNGHAPYGPKPLEEIRRLSAESVGVLLDRGVKAVVIACNTATSAYAEILRAELKLPVIGMEPALKPAQEARHGGEILVLATQATLTLPKFQRLMKRYGDHVIPVVGRGLVELVEAGKADSPETEAALRELLGRYVDRSIDSVVLGCTHYPFLAGAIRRMFPEAELFDGRTGTCMRLKYLLEAGGLRSKGTEGSVEFLTSGDASTIALMRRLMAELD